MNNQNLSWLISRSSSSYESNENGLIGIKACREGGREIDIEIERNKKRKREIYNIYSISVYIAFTPGGEHTKQANIAEQIISIN